MLAAFQLEAAGVLSRYFLAPPSSATRPSTGAPGTSTAARELSSAVSEPSTGAPGTSMARAEPSSGATWATAPAGPPERAPEGVCEPLWRPERASPTPPTGPAPTPTWPAPPTPPTGPAPAPPAPPRGGRSSCFTALCPTWPAPTSESTGVQELPISTASPSPGAMEPASRPTRAAIGGPGSLSSTKSGARRAEEGAHEEGSGPDSTSTRPLEALDSTAIERVKEALAHDVDLLVDRLGRQLRPGEFPTTKALGFLFATASHSLSTGPTPPVHWRDHLAMSPDPGTSRSRRRSSRQTRAGGAEGGRPRGTARAPRRGSAVVITRNRHEPRRAMAERRTASFGWRRSPQLCSSPRTTRPTKDRALQPPPQQRNCRAPGEPMKREVRRILELCTSSKSPEDRRRRGHASLAPPGHGGSFSQNSGGARLCGRVSP